VRSRLWLTALLCSTGCFGSPTPLAPQLQGSVGLPHQGTLTEAVLLPVRGPGFQRYRPHSPRYYGTEGLVRALTRLGQRLEAQFPGGPPLVIGDLSARRGGRISGHSSHRSGRDVDLLYFATTLEGRPVTTPGFVHFGPDGLARPPGGGFLRFDPARNWAVVRHLLTDPDTDVVWMFASRDIEKLLLSEGLARGEPPELLFRAAQVLHEPRDSANHDDHFHVRIGCTETEQLAGCSSGGPLWPWLLPGPSLSAALEEELLAEVSPWTLP